MFFLQGASETQKNIYDNQRKNASRMELHKWDLENDQETYFGAGQNSNAYMAIHESLQDFVIFIRNKESFTGEITSDKQLLKNGIEKYDNITKACEKYLSSHKPPRFTDIDNQRKLYTQQILKDVREEKENIFEAYVYLINDYKQKLKNYNIIKSPVSKNSPDEQKSPTLKENSPLFDEDRDSIAPAPPTFADVVKLARTEVIDITGRTDVNKPEQGNTSYVLKIGEGSSTRFFKKDSFNSLVPPDRKQILLHNLAIRAAIPAFAEIQKRNIATYRLACLLGIKDLVVKAKPCIIRQKDMEDMHGIVMDQAKGKIALLFFHKSSAPLSKSFFTSTATNQCNNLKILDLIAGQIDRNFENLFMQSTTEANVSIITGVQGIDSDLSFGILGEKYLYTHFKIQFMDITLANKISALTDDIINFYFADLLSDREIYALIIRIKWVQNFIKIMETRQPKFFKDEPDFSSLSSDNPSALEGKLKTY